MSSTQLHKRLLWLDLVFCLLCSSYSEAIAYRAVVIICKSVTFIVVELSLFGSTNGAMSLYVLFFVGYISVQLVYIGYITWYDKICSADNKMLIHVITIKLIWSQLNY